MLSDSCLVDKRLNRNIVQLFFFPPAKNQLQELTRSTRGPIEYGLCIWVLAASLARGPAESPRSFEDNGVRFGLDYTRHGYLT